MYINLHSHHFSPSPDWVIQNIHKNFDNLPVSGIYSAGIHPCYIQKDESAQWQSVLQCLSQTNVVAVGECGLDKRCVANWQTQQAIFQLHIQGAVKFQKPLIIHCVRAFEEVQSMLTHANFTLPVIFHGFRKSSQLAKELIHKGYYLSFGTALQHEGTRDTFAQLPLQQLFLETDDQDVAIEQVYKWAALATGLSVESLILQFRKNAQTVFKNQIFHE